MWKDQKWGPLEKLKKLNSRVRVDTVMLLFDGREMRVEEIEVRRDPNCLTCVGCSCYLK